MSWTLFAAILRRIDRLRGPPLAAVWCWRHVSRLRISKWRTQAMTPIAPASSATPAGLLLTWNPLRSTVALGHGRNSGRLGNAMSTRMFAAGFIAAGLFTTTCPTHAQDSYPDLKGTWVGPGQSVTWGKTDQWPDAGAAAPVFRKGSWTIVIDRQEDNLLTGTQEMTGGARRDPLLGVIRGDRATVLMVDDDGSFQTILTGADTMEMCRIEVTADSRIVGCRQLARQK